MCNELPVTLQVKTTKWQQQQQPFICTQDNIYSLKEKETLLL